MILLVDFHRRQYSWRESRILFMNELTDAALESVINLEQR